jgi:tetratricopeptide (TPR) repeat protein
MSRALIVLGSVALTLVGLATGCTGSSSPGESGPTSVGPPIEIDLDRADPETAEMLSELLAATRAEPHVASPRADLGMAYEMNGFRDAAMRCYEQAALIEPGEARWSYLLAQARADVGDLEGALAAMDDSRRANDSYVPSHLYRGQWLLDLGRPGEAEAAYRSALDLDPDSPPGQAGLARALIRRGRPDEAAEMLEAIASERPGDAYLYQLMGTAYREMGDVEKARAVLAGGRPDAPAPGWEDPWSAMKRRFVAGYGAEMARGEEFLSTGQNDQAIAIFESLRQQRPDDFQLLNNLSVAYRRAGRENESLEVLEAGLKSNPDYFPFHMNVASAYERHGEFELALKHLERVIQINPSLGLAYQRKGLILFRARRLGDALRAFESALSYESGDPTNFLYAGVILTRMDDCERAVRRLEVATRLNPKLGQAYLALAECQATLREFEEAERALQRAAELAPDSPLVAETRARVDQLKSKQP